MSQRRSAVGRSLRRGYITFHIFVPALRNADLQKLEGAGYPRQQIVEIVCQPARELSNGLHLLSLPQSVFRLVQSLLLLALLRNVTRDTIEQTIDIDCRPRQNTIVSPAGTKAAFKIRRLFWNRQATDCVAHFPAVIGMLEPFRCLASNLIRQPAQHLGPGRVDADPRPIRSRYADQIEADLPYSVALLRALRNS